MPHSFKEHLPEYGHNRRPKHVAGHAEYNIRISTCWLFLIRDDGTVELLSRLLCKHKHRRYDRYLTATPMIQTTPFISCINLDR